MINIKGPISVVAHDAGGANQIISFLQANLDKTPVHPHMRGPALKLWNAAFPQYRNFCSLDSALAASSLLISGTGWQTDLEFDAISKASEIGIHSIGFLDHWVNYKQRFSRKGITKLPDEFWVVDKFAYEIASKTFKNKIITQVDDNYLISQLTNIRKFPTKENILLYITEPSRNNWGKLQPGEFQALDYLLENLHKISNLDHIKILLRPHPSENLHKFDGWIKSNPSQEIIVDNSISLASAISKAKWVAGCESYGLVVALASGRTVYSALPPWAPACRLPHSGILHLKDNIDFDIGIIK
tara:strand:+ start:874 stop:1773 length:900 start_codon:yes stop_codon:yes gene_type:complete